MKTSASTGGTRAFAQALLAQAPSAGRLRRIARSRLAPAAEEIYNILHMYVYMLFLD